MVAATSEVLRSRKMLKFKMIPTALALLGISSAFAQYKVEPSGAPPADLAPAISALLSKTGHRIIAPDGKVWCELWFVAKEPAGPKSAESDVSWATVPHGSIIGAIRWPAPGYDRRGQMIKPGVYTLRNSLFPINGDHQGVAPQRDFLLMAPASEDKSGAAIVSFDALAELSKKASATQHPAVLSMWKVDADFKSGMNQSGETDWALHVKIGDASIALIVVGKVEG